jgi:hypothetical protein
VVADVGARDGKRSRAQETPLGAFMEARGAAVESEIVPPRALMTVPPSA